MTISKKPFVKAEEGPNNSVIYYDEDGNKLIRYWKKRDDEPVEQASTRSWRNNNPGNLVNGDFAKKNGWISRGMMEKTVFVAGAYHVNTPEQYQGQKEYCLDTLYEELRNHKVAVISQNN